MTEDYKVTGRLAEIRQEILDLQVLNRLVAKTLEQLEAKIDQAENAARWERWRKEDSARNGNDQEAARTE